MWGREDNIELNSEGEDAREYSPGEKYYPGQKIHIQRSTKNKWQPRTANKISEKWTTKLDSKRRTDCAVVYLY